MQQPQRRSLLKLLLLGASSSWLLGCGLKLRQTGTAAFTKLSSNLDFNTNFGKKFVFLLHRNTNIRLVSAELAEVKLEILSDSYENSISSLSSKGVIQERKLTRKLSYQLRHADGHIISEASTIEVDYNFSFPEELTPAKQLEEQQLRRNMDDEIIHQLIYRLTSINAI